VKAIVQDRFGPPESLQLLDVDEPRIGPDDVLVRVRAAAANPYDWHMLRGDPYVARLAPVVGHTRPRTRIAGIDAAGEVAAVGADVRGLAVGDAVFGFCKGAFAEYVAAPAELVVPKPVGLSFEEAAALPMAASTALRGIRDVGEVRAGQRVLVNGAGGGVGSFAVQLAASLGAEVTGVCSTRNVELVRSLGAEHVVDYTVADFTDGSSRYDVVLDNVGNRPLRRVLAALAPRGTLVLNGGGSPGAVFGAVATLLRAKLLNLVVAQRLVQLPTVESRENLLTVARHAEAGTLRPVVDRTYPLAGTADAVSHVEQGHARGKVVVTVT
jgi:NADPH:quinone reductase-like Zn-dependent oxidoreductase